MKFARKKFIRHIIVVVIIVVCCFVVLDVTLFAENTHKYPVEELRKPLAQSQTPCKRPQLNINDTSLSKFFHPVPPLQCSLNDWVCVRKGYSTAGICRTNNTWPLSSPEKVTCSYKFMKRSSENSNEESHRTTVQGTQDVTLDSDVFHVYCRDGSHPSGLRWHNLMTGIARNEIAWKRTVSSHSGMLGLNVLFVGIDSLSRLSFMRKLPNTYRYITDVLEGVVLEGYNIVGDGTPQALIPMLTGKTEQELPETRKRKFFSANHVNIYPFVWNDFRNSGYVTGYAEDSTTYGAFTYRLKGFDQQPTDHYMRPFYVEVDKVVSEHKHLCLGGQPRHKVWLDWMEDFFDVYAKKPKFMFGFHGELSHDDLNTVGLADVDIVNFLKSLGQKGHLDSTLLVVMSDHGHRFSAVRKTAQGKQEERLPFFSLVLPKWFKTKYRNAWYNLKTNSERLTSPFDIYSTLWDIIHYKENNNPVWNNKRSISLFDEIPAYRTCADAGIELHWCTCLNWGMISTDDPVIRKAANAFVIFVNNMTAVKRELCHEVQLDKITQAERYAPLTALLQYKQNWDLDGFEGDFSDTTVAKEELYQIQLNTRPGKALYEVTLHYSVNQETFYIDAKSISRINSYGNSSLCIEEFGEIDLRKYCCCRATCN